MHVKSCCVITKSSGHSAWAGVAKWRAVNHGRDGPCGFCGKKALKSQIFILSNLQFVERKHMRTALCSTGYGASTLARKPHRWLSVSGITIPLKNGCVKPFRSSQAGGSDVYTRKGIC